ncbi:zinc-dependent alcohol dehydrogenase family protein [Geochorda subterranea]|uniref:Zinc-dependent alcohol dehydrogenase family protein n=2 Tax=Geochorda subterranea TaxID=3109564 RepID=A0ABZ1BUZ9_9FIRM|nr:zinc-dependent alcohol dehydrogenase family protein [Limnochorda sp. LNt]WRP15988.1 zinc-dependent alcohol dehydrogenase family protein [Limnochorda sp. LNt]
MVIRAFGGPEVFDLQEVPDPTPGPGELRVRVAASSVNPVDYKIRRNGAWAGVRPPAIIGYDVSGVVDAVGPGVTEWRQGDEVYYTPEIFGGRPGSYAQYHVVDAAIVARKPRNLDHVQAAAVPLAGGTAWDALVVRAGVRAGETVLIHGGAGGVGHFAVQIARASGCRVLATCSRRNLDFVRELGADVAIDYEAEDFVERTLRETDGQGVDVVFDTVGGPLLARSIEATRPGGRLVSIVSAASSLDAAHRKNLTVHFLFLLRERRRLDALRSLIERGLLRPVVDEVLPLEQVARAHARLESGHGRGKIVLEIPSRDP